MSVLLCYASLSILMKYKALCFPWPAKFPNSTELKFWKHLTAKTQNMKGNSSYCLIQFHTWQPFPLLLS